MREDRAGGQATVAESAKPKRKTSVALPISEDLEPFIGLDATEAEVLAEIIAEKSANPAANKSVRGTDEMRMRAERLHLLAWLASVPTRPEEDQPLDLWVAWRKDARVRNDRDPADRTDWCSEVNWLRALHQRPGKVLRALKIARVKQWKNFDWKWLDENNGRGQQAPEERAPDQLEGERTGAYMRRKIQQREAEEARQSAEIDRRNLEEDKAYAAT